MTHERRRGVALHEAAHLVTSHLVGLRVTAVDVDLAGLEIEERRRLAGFVENSRGQADPFSDVVAMLAGFVFDLLRPGETDYIFAAADDDREAAWVSASVLDARDPDAVLNRATAVANQLLQRHWAAVERLADRIVDAGRIEGDRLLDEIEAALDGLHVDAWVTVRREQINAAADRAEREAIWAARRRWHGWAAPETKAIYDTLPAARRERADAALTSQREAIEAAAGHPPAGTVQLTPLKGARA